MLKISVLMPVYNAEQFLENAIDSIIEQTFQDWELIIIDDGSTDRSPKIIDTYKDRRIRFYQNKINLGLIDTLNRGISLCKGQFIARMDADDISLPTRLQEQYSFLEAYPEYAMCGTNAILLDQEGNIGHIISNYRSNDLLQINLLFSVPFIHPTMMIRSEILSQFKYDSEYKHAEDYDLWSRVAEKYKIANLSSVQLQYRWHSSNVSVVYSEIQDRVKDKIICRELFKLGLIPSEEELFLHQISFRQKDIKNSRQKESFTNFDALDKWYAKIIEGNNIYGRYNEPLLISFLWVRWLVVCIAQRKYNYLKPRFLKFRFYIFRESFNQLLFLWKKK